MSQQQQGSSELASPSRFRPALAAFLEAHPPDEGDWQLCVMRDPVLLLRQEGEVCRDSNVLDESRQPAETERLAFFLGGMAETSRLMFMAGAERAYQAYKHARARTHARDGARAE
jgi:hypothetical protein